ncbi:unnamed protein product [Meganyctiphanes norvegica]|uniref:Uncharacterized protein n=1 Tax=Meganyctiphanes norvegica TaxID=48144 RepID=A0AAV2PPT9_MEGNR
MHVIYILCLVNIMITHQVLSLRYTSNYCIADYSQIGIEFYMANYKHNKISTLWLWPLEDVNISFHIKGSENKTVPLTASIDFKTDWKIIEIKFPCSNCVSVGSCSLKCDSGSINLKALDCTDNDYTHIMAFEKHEETSVSIQSDKNLLWTDCPPDWLSDTNLQDLYKKSLSKSAETIKQTFDKNTKSTKVEEDTGSILGLAVILVISLVVMRTSSKFIYM